MFEVSINLVELKDVKTFFICRTCPKKSQVQKEEETGDLSKREPATVGWGVEMQAMMCRSRAWTSASY